MLKNAIFICVLAAGMWGLGGCVIVDKQKPSPAPAPRHYDSPPPDDGRSAQQLRSQNAALRSQLQKLEDDNRRWESAITHREAEIRDLKRQRDDLKKDRDRYKKLANLD
jgi:chromosome segregation ATPase